MDSRLALVAASALAACGGGPASSASDASSSSAEASEVCAQALQHLRDNVFPDPVMLKYGDWGAIPPALQKLPPDGTLCGSVGGDAGSAGTVILTQLSPRDLYNLYAPLIEAAGCSPASDPNAGPLFTFLCSDATPAVIDASDPNHAYVVLGFG